MIGNRTYLAKIDDFAAQRNGRAKLAWAEPLVRSTEDRDAWEGLVANPEDDFPDRGLVFWYDAPRETTGGDYWEIEVGEQPNYDGHQKTERYQVTGHRRPVEVVDLRDWTDEDEVRRALNSEGISIEPPPIESEVIFWTADERWVGPVQLARTDAGKWILEVNDPTRLGCWAPGRDAYREVQLDESRLIAAPGHDFGESLGYANWASDVEFAKGLLKRIRKLDQSAYEALDVTYAVFEKYQEVLAESGLSGRELQHERARSERAEELRSLIEANEELLSETVSALLESEAVRSELEEEKQKLLRETKERAEREVSRQLASKRSQLDELDSQIEARYDDLEEVESELEEENERLEEQVASFEDVLRERLDELADVELEDLFAHSVTLRTILSATRSDASRSDPPPTAPEEEASRTPWKLEEQPEHHEEVGEAAQLFSKRVIAGGLGSGAMTTDLFTAFLASGTVCLDGARAGEILDAFADTVVGGRLLWIPVPGASIAPTDFLVSQDGGRVAPHPNGLLDVLVEANSSDRLYLVVFEGFDRAPVESYLHPLLASRSESVKSGRERRAVPLPSSVTVADRSVARVAWPANVLVACIPSGGTTATLPVPPGFWNFASLVGADSYEDDGKSEFFDVEEERSIKAVGATAWNGTRQQMQEEADTTPVSDAARAAFDADARFDVSLARDLYAAARSLGRGGEDTLATAARLGLLPRAAYGADATPSRVEENFHLSEETAETVTELTKTLFE